MLIVARVISSILWLLSILHHSLIEIHKMVRPSYLLAFLTGPIQPGIIPHASSGNLLGFHKKDIATANELIKTSKTSINGVTSFWFGGFFQGLYITSNASRNLLIREEIMGVTSDFVRKYHHAIHGNNVMTNFLVWQNINSDMYKMQRHFLDVNFQKNVRELLPSIKNHIEDYVDQYSGEHSLKKFVFGLTLYIGSRLPVIGMPDYTLDMLFHAEKEFEQAVYKIALYGTARRGVPAFESYLYQVFLRLMKENFESIQSSEVNLLKNIFESREIPFPEHFEDIKNIDPVIMHQIAMNFFSVAVAAMIHTTSNSLDWSLAYLSKHPDEMKRLKSIVENNADLNICDRRTFENELRPVRDLILSNVYENPTFSHEFFVCNSPFTTTLPDGSEMHVPSNTIIVVNYLECNRAENSPPLANHTTEGFTMDKHVASFGGSIKNENNAQSRLCPGRIFSLFEQMIILTTLLNHYDISFKDVDDATDNSHFPVHTRVNSGTISLQRKGIQNEAVPESRLTYLYREPGIQEPGSSTEASSQPTRNIS